MANIYKIQKALYPHIPKNDPSMLYPLNIYKKYPLSLYMFGLYPCIPKTLPGPHNNTQSN